MNMLDGLENVTMHPGTYEETKGEFTAAIAILDNGVVIQTIEFQKPVFKSKKKANRYAMRKMKELAKGMRKNFLAQGYDVEQNIPDDM